MIEATFFQQFFMITLFDDLAVFHNKNQRGITYRRQSVGYDKACPSLHQLIKCFLYLKFRTCINA